jgi:hypothetical protein
MQGYATDDVTGSLVEVGFLLPFSLLQTREPHNFEVIFQKIFL